MIAEKVLSINRWLCSFETASNCSLVFLRAIVRSPNALNVYLEHHSVSWLVGRDAFLSATSVSIFDCLVRCLSIVYLVHIEYVVKRFKASKQVACF